MDENENNEQNTNDTTPASPEELREIFKNRYGTIFEKLELFLYSKINKPLNGKTIDEFNGVLIILARYEKYVSNYPYKTKNDIYNFNNFYADYFKEISKDKDTFFIDLIYFLKIRYINLFIPELNQEYFLKNYILLYDSDPNKLLEFLCELYINIRNGKCNIDAIVYFTTDGSNYRNKNLIDYMINNAAKKQKELENNQLELQNKINSHTKEIVSIVALILAIAPIMFINVSFLKDFTLASLLVVNGSLIIGITTIFFVVATVFVDLKKKHAWLLLPLVIGIALILLSIKYNDILNTVSIKYLGK